MSITPSSADAVQDTNDSSTVSKLSASNAGYFVDENLKYFVSKPARRAPLIHRGYYIRWKAVAHILRVFLQQDTTLPMQLISLGAGFDTSFFRLHNQGLLYNCRVFEVDFPSVIVKKLLIISQTPHLQDCVGELKSVDDDVFVSDVYSAIGCNISNLPALQSGLKKASVDFRAPTLFLSECVLTYINPSRVNALLAWTSISFADAVFCTYEQIQPDDAFGQVMQKHFQRLQSPLQNLSTYPTQQSQERRYLAAGWEECRSCDMNTIFSSLSAQERQRVSMLELFDEYEEWHLMCSHYTILCASNGRCRMLENQLLPSRADSVIPLHPCYGSCKVDTLNKTHDSAILKRYGHGSCMLADGRVLVIGGYGVASMKKNTPHSRLNDVLQLRTTEDRWEMHGLATQGAIPKKLMHHTVTAVASGTVALVIGGRGSPAQPSESMFLLQLNREPSSPAMWSKVQLHSESSYMEPRWRHTATYMQLDNGEECVLIVGGSTTRSCALSDMYSLNTITWRLMKLCVALPEGRSSHCAVCWHGGLIIAGGINSSLVPISSCLHLTSTQADGWQMSAFEFKPPLPPLYSMSGSISGDRLVLLGGVGLQRSPDVVVVHLTHKSWFGLGLQVPCSIGSFLLCNHTCCRVGNELVVLGGGGNCFSFGTYLNSELYSINIDR